MAPRGRSCLRPADPAVGEVEAAAGDPLHQGLDLLPLPEGVEHRRDRAQLQRVGADEHQVVEDPGPLGHQHPDPGRPLGHLQVHLPLHDQGHAQLVADRRDPVVPVDQGDDLPVVAVLGQLLERAVHVADHRLGVLDHLAVEGHQHPQHPVGGRVLGADVQGHVLGVQLPVGLVAHDDADAGAVGGLEGRPALSLLGGHATPPVPWRPARAWPPWSAGRTPCAAGGPRTPRGAAAWPGWGGRRSRPRTARPSPARASWPRPTGR